MTESTNKSTSGLAIAGLVLGIIAALTSFLPIINNISAFIAVIGGVLAAIALVGAGKKGQSKGMPIAGVVLAVVSFAIVLASQSFYVSALRNATKGAEVESTSTSSATSSTPAEGATTSEAPAAAEPAPQEQPQPADTSNLAVGATANLSDGLSVTVNSVEGGLTKYDGTPVLTINVTYVNNGSKNASFNVYDWKGEDAGGAQRTSTYVYEAEGELNSGTLSPGGNVTGNIYFEEGITRVLYYSNMFNDAPTAGWTIA